jgi:hypothetical protein
MTVAGLSVKSASTRQIVHAGKRALTEFGQQAVTNYGVLVMEDQAQVSAEVQPCVYRQCRLLAQQVLGRLSYRIRASIRRVSLVLLTVFLANSSR